MRQDRNVWSGNRPADGHNNGRTGLRRRLLRSVSVLEEALNESGGDGKNSGKLEPTRVGTSHGGVVLVGRRAIRATGTMYLFVWLYGPRIG